MFESIDDVIERFAQRKYICNRSIATVVFLASRMHKPILVEGPAGVGKTGTREGHRGLFSTKS